MHYRLIATRGFQDPNNQNVQKSRHPGQRSLYRTTAVRHDEGLFRLSPSMSWSNQRRKQRSLQLKLSPTKNNFEPDVSIPGVTILFNESGWIRKTVWGIAVTFCIFICLVQVGHLLLEFWNVPVIVDIDIYRDENPLFPAITICPYYPFRYNKILRERLRAVNANLTKATSSSNLIFPFFSVLQLPEENVTNLWQYGQVRDNDVESKLLCKSFSTAMNCELKIIHKEIVTYLGICTSYTLNDRIKYDGPYNGINLYYYVHGNIGKNHYTVIFHHPDDDPANYLFKDVGSVVQSFIRTCILYTRQEFRNANTPHHPCLPRKQAHECYKKCVEQYIIENVTCRLPYLTSNVLQLCTTPESADNTYSMTLQAYHRVDEVCEHCPRKCEDDIYRLSETTLTEHNFTLLTFHMIDNVVQVVTELTPYTFDKVLSDIGGMLGLFMGVCLLTLLQLLEALFFRIKLKLNG